MFTTQLVFIGCRTWNVRAIACHNVIQAMVSGGIVHLAWLVSIAIGAISMNEIITHFKLEYTPVILCSLCGGLLGTWLGLQKKRK